MKKTLFGLLTSCTTLLAFIVLTSFFSVSKTKSKVDDPPFYLRIELRDGTNDYSEWGGGSFTSSQKTDMYVCAYADYNCTIPYVVPQDFDFEYHEENALEYWSPGVNPATFSGASYVTTFPGGVSEFKYDDDLPIFIYTYFADIDLAEIYSINPMVRCATSNVKYVGLKTKDGGIPPYNPGYYIKLDLPDCNCN
jgi:hypothetical protein